MPVARKAAVSLLICVLIFASFCIFSFTSLFDIIETRFYSRAVFNELNNALAADADFIENYLSELQKRFSDILRENAIRNSFWVNQSGEDIYERGRIFSALAVSLPELQWVRFVRADGNRIDYSTNPDDQITTGTGAVLYKNYPEVNGYIPFDQQMLSGISTRRIVFDEKFERLIFYYPFYDSMDIHRGEALFSISMRAFNERLIENTRIKMSDDISVISSPTGIVIGIPQLEMAPVKKAIASIWASGAPALSRIYSSPSNPMALLSLKTSHDIFIGLLVPEKALAFPDTLKALLIGAVFITLFVVMFLILNVKQDPVAVVQNRLKELQVSLMHEYYQLMGDMDWAVWRRELEQRRADVKQELCRGLKIKKGGDIESYIDSFFNRSWDSLLAAIGSRTGMITNFDEAKLEAILSRVLTQAKPSSSGDNPDFQEADNTDHDEDDNNGYDDNDEDISDADILDDDSFEVLEPLDDGPSGQKKNADSYNGYEVEDFGDDAGASPADGKRYDDAEELEELDDPDFPSRDGGDPDESRYNKVEETPALPPAEEPAAKNDPDGDNRPYNEEFQNTADDISVHVYSPKTLWGAADVENTGEVSEDEAWLKLAEETAAMEPSEIWAELVEKPKSQEVHETVSETGPDTRILSGDILEEDPFSDSTGTDTSDDGRLALSETKDPTYGEFIQDAAEYVPKPPRQAPVLSADTLYNVEEFADADDDDNPAGLSGTERQRIKTYAPESPRKADDIDTIARKTEFTPSTEKAPVKENDFNADVSPPFNETFTGAGKPPVKRAGTTPSVPAKAVNAASVPAGKARLKAREIKTTHTPYAKTNAVYPFQFFSQNSNELELLEAVDDEDEETVIKKHKGVDYINTSALKAASAGKKNVDPKMKKLVDSVLRKN